MRLGVGGVKYPPTSFTMVAFLFVLGFLKRGAGPRGVEDGKERNTEGERRVEGRKDIIVLLLVLSEDAMSILMIGEETLLDERGEKQ